VHPGSVTPVEGMQLAQPFVHVGVVPVAQEVMGVVQLLIGRMRQERQQVVGLRTGVSPAWHQVTPETAAAAESHVSVCVALHIGA
jgi:hypothetical protein